ncbi:hypothetical protein NUM3379_09830 [Kineococcus sp. NUM-3379]
MVSCAEAAEPDRSRATCGSDGRYRSVLTAPSAVREPSSTTRPTVPGRGAATAGAGACGRGAPGCAAAVEGSGTGCEAGGHEDMRRRAPREGARRGGEPGWTAG